MIRAALYCRVSTSEQDPAHQLSVLREVASRRGWAATEYVETVSGAARDRPAFDRMMADVRRRKVDVVAAVDLSRLARSVTVLMGMLDELRVVGCDLYSDRESIDTSTAAGRMMFAVVAAVAEFERSIIIERTVAGLATARAKGVRLGRPPTGDGMLDAIRSLREQGLGINSIARELRVGKSTVQRVADQMKGEAAHAQG
jgi:DNA invertase Pin-like site-specific DNA recombinase